MSKEVELAIAFNEAVRRTFVGQQVVDTRVVCHAAATPVLAFTRQLPADLRTELVERFVTAIREIDSQST